MQRNKDRTQTSYQGEKLYQETTIHSNVNHSHDYNQHENVDPIKIANKIT